MDPYKNIIKQQQQKKFKEKRKLGCHYRIATNLNIIISIKCIAGTGDNSSSFEAASLVSAVDLKCFAAEVDTLMSTVMTLMYLCKLATNQPLVPVTYV